MSRPKGAILLDLALMAASSLSVFYMLSWALDRQQDQPKASKSVAKRADDNYKRLRLQDPAVLSELDGHEKMLLANVVGPDEIKTGFAEIGGLDDIVEELREAVLYPLMRPELFAQYSKLLQAPKGVLLFGPPGCGKTMLAKALAKESGANFLNIKMSTILDKFYGESNKIVAAMFSLAQKLSPCILFIDEIDSFLRERSSSDHELTSMLKGEFMTLWDGLETDGRVMVLGATNRPNDIDKAILRRLAKKFPVSLPKPDQRLKILKIVLADATLEPGFDWEFIIDQTSGFSGSELEELCRDALMRPMRENLRENIKRGSSGSDILQLRPLGVKDFFVDGPSAKRMAYNYVPEEH